MSGSEVALGNVLRALRHPGIDDPVYLAFWLSMPLLIAWWIELRHWPRPRARPATRRGLLVGFLVATVLACLMYAYLYGALRTGLIHCVAKHACRWRCESGEIGCGLIQPPSGRASMAFTPAPFWTAYVFLSAFILTPLLAWWLVCLKAFSAWRRMPWRTVSWYRRG